MAKGLTKRQRAILEFIQEFILNERFPPTLREIGQHFGMRSTNGVNDHLRSLETKGYIKRRKDISRGMEILRLPEEEGTQARKPARPGRPNKLQKISSEGTVSVSIPILGKVAAGTPITAVENHEGVLRLDGEFWKRRPDYALEVRGDSMIGVGINEGDLCLVKQQSDANNGDIGVAMLEDEATVKRYKFDGKQVTLLPENPRLQPIPVKDLENFSILGLVVGVIREY